MQIAIFMSILLLMLVVALRFIRPHAGQSHAGVRLGAYLGGMDRRPCPSVHE